MNYKNIALFSMALVIGCPMPIMAETAATDVSKNQVNEGNLLGTLVVLNQNEIAAGTLAEKTTTNSSVKSFAEMMVKEHSDNLEKTNALATQSGITPAEGVLAVKLKNKGKNELTTLEHLKGSAFDKAYINDMVTGHKQALALVTLLIHQSTNPSVKEHLEKTKMHVQHHLEKAQAIQASLQ